MGVMYYLAREDNRTLFEVGKFSEISNIFVQLGEGSARDYEWMPREVPPEPDLRARVRAAVDGLDLSVDLDAYAGELARRVVAFAGGHPVCLLNDCSSDETLDDYADDDGDLRVVDSVYVAAWGDATVMSSSP